MSDKEHRDARPVGSGIFEWVRSTGWHRPHSSWVGGVLAAVGDRLGWDAALVRGLGVLAFIVATAPTALLYGLAWILLPDRKGQIHAERALRGDFTSGAAAGGLLAVVGLLNLFTPAAAGPLQFLLNVAVLGAVAWIALAAVRRISHRQGPEADHPDRGGSAGPREAQASSRARRAPQSDRPAWYPKDGPEPTPAAGQAHRADQTSAKAGPQSQTVPLTRPSYGEPRSASGSGIPYEEKRRRRLVTFGLLLLTAPAVGAAMLFASVIGLSAAAAALTVLAAFVSLTALLHIGAGLRGRRGPTALLTVLTGAMLVLALMQSAGSATHVFGSYATSSEEVNTAFANTTVDLTDPQSFAGTDQGYAHEVEINGGFGNVDVVVPDDARVTVTAAHAFSNLDFRTQTLTQSQAGIGSDEQRFGPADEGDDAEAAGEIDVHINQAFGNVTIFDATTFAEEN